MLLAIDAGNTNIVFAVYEGDKMRAQWRAVTKPRAPPTNMRSGWASFWRWKGLSFADLDAAIIATVVPAVLFDLRQLCRKYLKTEPLLVGDPALDLGHRSPMSTGPRPWAPTGCATPWRRMTAIRAR